MGMTVPLTRAFHVDLVNLTLVHCIIHYRDKVIKVKKIHHLVERQCAENRLICIQILGMIYPTV